MNAAGDSDYPMSGDVDDHLRCLLEHIQRELPVHWPQWPGGWPEQAELALIDAVLSIRARYGRSAGSGVRRSVELYREHRAQERADDLAVLAGFDPEPLAALLDNRQKTAGVLKAAAIVQAAQRLVAAGARHAANMPDASARAAYVGVRGLGPVTWEYLLMLLGQPGVKADRWIVRFVEQGLGRTVTSNQAGLLLKRTAEDLGVSPIALDYAIWRYMSERRHAQAA